MDHEIRSDRVRSLRLRPIQPTVIIRPIWVKGFGPHNVISLWPGAGLPGGSRDPRRGLQAGERRPARLHQRRRRGRGSAAVMDSFSSQSGAPSEEEVMEKLRAHFAQAYAQEILEAVGDKCFTVCVTKPETSFSRSEGNCVSNCMERYIEATRIISRAVLNSQP